MMKKLFLNIVLSLSLVAPVAIVTNGCTTSQQRITYNTLYSLGDAVNRSYASYNDQVVTGKAVFNTSVAKAYNDFQAALNVAANAASMNLNAVAPQNLVDLANAVYGAIKQYTK